MDDSLTALVAAAEAGLHADGWSDRISDLADLVGSRLRGETRYSPSPHVRVRQDADRVLDIEIAVWRPGELADGASSWAGSLARVAIGRRQDPRPERVALFAVVVGAPEEISLPPELGDLLTEYDTVVIGLINDRERWLRLRAGTDPAPVANLGAALACLTAPPGEPEATDEPAGDRPAEDDGRLRFLLMATEWGSKYGGLSTLNRDLATALAAAGVDVRVCVPEATPADVAQALQDAGVSLVAPDPVPGITGDPLLLAGPRVIKDEDYRPDVIVGHGRQTGPYAYALKQRIFPGARRVHVVHTDAELLEQAKEEPDGDSRMMTADERRRIEISLARSADLVVGVGPLLARLIDHRMRGPAASPEVFELRPGLRGWEKQIDLDRLPEFKQVLLVARAEDIRSKGIDVAVRALKSNVAVHSGPGDRPMLVIRGVPEDEANEVRQEVTKIAGESFNVILRPYTTSQDELLSDLWGSRLVVMPSRHEGFGLAAYEAIAVGVPVLISEESGLAIMLSDLARNNKLDPPPEVVSMQGRPGEVTARWADTIDQVLKRPKAAYARAAELRQHILDHVGWDRTTADLLQRLDLDRAPRSRD
jgi:D-inositol-3-phosphate glycosyltransferase